MNIIYTMKSEFWFYSFLSRSKVLQNPADRIQVQFYTESILALSPAEGERQCLQYTVIIK